MADGEDAETDEKTDGGEGETRADIGAEAGAQDGEDLTDANGEDLTDANGEDLTDANGEDDIPPAPLWAMRTRMHSLRRLEPGDEDRIRRRLGSGDEAVYVIDDGPDHCMVGRRVGHDSDGCVYSLVARISLDRYADLVDGDVDLSEAFSDARDISLCGVFEAEQTASNVILVQHYRRPRDVPDDYLPPSPFIEFTDSSDEEDSSDEGDGDITGG